MPTYEYKCEACGNQFEKFQSITAPAIRKCPKCGKNKVKRLIGTGAGLIFKGSGFYTTDYRSDSYKNAAKNESPAPAKSEGDSKPAGAETPKPAPAASSSGSDATPAAKPAPSPRKKSGK